MASVLPILRNVFSVTEGRDTPISKDEQKNLLDSLKEIISKIKTPRDVYLKKLEDFFDGEGQREYIKKFEAETGPEFTNRKNNLVIENHCEDTILTAATYEYSKPVGRRVDDEKAQKELQAMLEFNREPHFYFDLAVNKGISGFSVIKNRFINRETGKDFDENASVSELQELGTIEFILMDSRCILPLPCLDNKRKVGAYLLEFKEDDQTQTGYDIFERLAIREIKEKRVIEYVDDTYWLRWEDDEFVKAAPNFLNPYGDVNIPFSLYRNPGHPLRLMGDSDIKNILDLQVELNERISDDGVVIGYHSMPILALKGVTEGDFVRKPNSMLYLPRDADAFYLVWDDVLEASQIFKEELRENISNITNISDLSRGKLKNIGNLRSGMALAVAFQADRLLIQRKQARDKAAEKNHIWAALSMLEFHKKIEFESKRVEITFPKDALPIDELTETQRKAIELSTGMTNLFEEIKTNHPELTTDEEIEAFIEEAVAYQLQLRGQAPQEEPQTSQKKAREQVDAKKGIKGKELEN